MTIMTSAMTGPTAIVSSTINDYRYDDRLWPSVMDEYYDYYSDKYYDDYYDDYDDDDYESCSLRQSRSLGLVVGRWHPLLLVEVKV